MTVESMKVEEGKDYESDARKSKIKVQILMAIISALVMLLIIFVSLYAFALSPDDDSSNANKTTTTATIKTTDECETQECHRTANRMEKLMDNTADPCVDFSEYACGNFYKTAVIPDDRASTGPFDKVIDGHLKFLEELLTDPMQTNSTFEKKMRSLYNACMDEDAIEDRGLEDYTAEFRQDWPTLNSTWNKSSFDLQAVTSKYLGMFTEVLFPLYKRVDNDGDEPIWMLETDVPDLFLDKPTLMEERNSTKIMALEMYYKEFSMELGANEQVASVDAKEFVDTIIELAKMTVDPAERREISIVYNPTTLGDMDAKYPYLNWTEAVQSMFDIKTKKIEPSQKINIRDMNYTQNLGDLIDRTDDRIIQNLFGFVHAHKLFSGATKIMREIELNFTKVVDGVEKEAPRSEKCAKDVDSIYNYGMAKLISNKRFSQNAKKFMDGMIDNMKKSFKEGFESVDWMENKTKQAAVDKLAKMKSKVGIPTEHFEDDDIDNMYKDYEVKGQYISDYLQNTHVKSREYMNELGEVVKSWKWDDSMTTVNAYYEPDLNEIVFPLGILQPPFFGQDRPSYLNYGGIGEVIGHEIGHGFDAEGRNIDGKGSVRDWWTPQDAMKYEEKTQCFVDQYSRFNFTIGSTTYNLNPDLTKTEDVPDTVGLIHAFQAYKMYQKKEGANELPLPKLGLDKDQLFFLLFAQGWCTKSKPESVITGLGDNEHSLDKFRLLGPLQNHPGFAKAYNCKVGDYMNPKKKCTLW